jgi:hypothetical protein
LHQEDKKSFSNKKFLAVMIALIITLLIDTSLVKINDLIDKNFIRLQGKLMLFSINSSLCFFLQFIIIKYVTNSFNKYQLNKSIKVKAFYTMSLSSLLILSTLMGFMVFQQFYNSYYEISIAISIIAVSYGSAAAFTIVLSILFLSWYKSNHNLIVFLYFVSMLIIAANLIITAALTDAKLSIRPSHVSEYVGTSGDIAAARFQVLNDISKISSFMSFFSIWITTAILMNAYREKLIKSIIYWIILSIPLAYFLITYFYQFILGALLISYLEIDPIIVSISLGTFLSLSKPIGGLIFGVAFWNISKILRYEKNIWTSMIIAGWGIFLIFSTNQAVTQVVGPYPPFGLTTVTVLNVGAFLMLLGIYSSATLVSANNNLRKFIHLNASKLLSPIGQAELEMEVQKAVKKISQSKDILSESTQSTYELDEPELKKYLYHVIREVKKGGQGLAT